MTRTEHETVTGKDGGERVGSEARVNRANAITTSEGRAPGESRIVDDAAILTFHMRKGEDSAATQLRCLPAYWTNVRKDLGGPTANEIKPLGHRIDGTWLLVVVRCPDETLRAIVDGEISNVTRRATEREIRDIDEPIERAALEAIHLATWPEGPAAIDAIIEALEEMDAKETESDPRSGKAIVRTEGADDKRYHMVLELDRRGDSEEIQRGKAVEGAANIVAKAMSRAGISLGVMLTGTTVREDAVLVCIECSRRVHDAIRKHDAQGVRVMRIKDPECAGQSDIERMRRRFQTSFMGTMKSIRLGEENASRRRAPEFRVQGQSCGEMMNASGTRAAVEPAEKAANATKGSTAVAPSASSASGMTPSNAAESMLHGFLHPESLRTTMWQGMMSHGALSAVAYACCMIELISVGTTETVLLYSLIMNMMLLPVIRRWGAPALAVVNPTGAIRPRPLKAANDVAPGGTSRITAAAPVAALEAPAQATVDDEGETVERSWETILDALEADERTARVQDARRACDRLVAMTLEHDYDAHAAAVVKTIGTTLPRLAQDLARMLRHGDEPERGETIARIVEATGHLARSADAARRAMLRTVQDRITTTINYIETRAGSDDLSPLDDTRTAA